MKDISKQSITLFVYYSFLFTRLKSNSNNLPRNFLPLLSLTKSLLRKYGVLLKPVPFVFLPNF